MQIDFMIMLSKPVQGNKTCKGYNSLKKNRLRYDQEQQYISQTDIGKTY